jgi:hypothetical protein
VLVLGLGGGSDLLLAPRLAARGVDVVEPKFSRPGQACSSATNSGRVRASRPAGPTSTVGPAVSCATPTKSRRVSKGGFG